jgi:probable phosphoglycerate mutase
MDHIVMREKGKTVLVVTHGRYLRVLLASVLDDYGLDDMHRLDHANTCVNRVVHADGRFRAELLNCTAHLSPNGERK